jgi:hypothetical protein
MLSLVLLKNAKGINYAVFTIREFMMKQLAKPNIQYIYQPHRGQIVLHSDDDEEEVPKEG